MSDLLLRHIWRSCQRVRGSRIPQATIFRRQLRPYLLLGLGLLIGDVVGCSGDQTVGTTVANPSRAYWNLAVNHTAINLALTAPYDTVQLTATPLTGTGTPLAGAARISFQAADSTVTVTNTGLVTAHYVTTGLPTTVLVSGTNQGVTLTDTILIQVAQTAPQSSIHTFSMQPIPGDSARRTIDSVSFSWPAITVDGVGDTLCGRGGCSLQVYYTSSNPLVATIDRNSGVVTSIDTGHVVFTATMLAYGVTWRDSVRFELGPSLNYTEAIALDQLASTAMFRFGAPKQLILGLGAVVMFWDKSPRLTDVVFDDTAGVDSVTCPFLSAGPTGTGNIPSFGGDTTRIFSITYASANDLRCRRFTKTGVYHYHSTLLPSDTFAFEIRPND